jgi:hypothetical protein
VLNQTDNKWQVDVLGILRLKGRRARQRPIQNSVQEMGLKLEAIAKELDQVVAESRTVVAGKKNPPA